MTSYANDMIRWVNRYGKKEYPKGFAVPEGFVVPNGHPREWVLPPGVAWPARYIFACRDGETPTMLGAPDSGRAAAAGAEAAPAPPGPPRGGTPSCIPTPIFVAGGNV